MSAHARFARWPFAVAGKTCLRSGHIRIVRLHSTGEDEIHGKLLKSMTKPVLRCSSLPLFMTCSPAVFNPDKLTVVDQSIEASEAGTLIHALAEDFVSTGSFDLEPLRKRLSKEDYDRAGRLMRNFLAMWKEAKQHVTSPETEIALRAETDTLILTGHIDLLSSQPGQAYLIDYKTGRQHEDHYHQLAGYAFLVWDRAGRPREYIVNASAVYLEDLSVHAYRFTAKDIQKWTQQVDTQALDSRYIVSRKCAGCHLSSGCPAHLAFVSGAIAAFTEGTAIPGKTWESMRSADRGRLLDRIYVIERAIDRAKLGLRNTVRAKGSLDIGDGKEMVLVDETNTFLDTRRALPVLNKKLGPDVLAQVARLPLDDVLSAYSRRASKGRKLKAREDLLALLKKANAVISVVSTKMFRRPKDEKKLEVK